MLGRLSLVSQMAGYSECVCGMSAAATQRPKLCPAVKVRDWGGAEIISRIYYSLARCAFRLSKPLLARLSVSASSSLAYLASLLDQRRYGEFDALVRHGARKLIGGSTSLRSSGRRIRRPILIDARTERLTVSGALEPKLTFSFPSDQTPLLVSIVIPCYNYGRYVEEAIASVLAQTLTSREIFVIDDGSTDPATLAVLDRLGAQGQVQVIRQDNQGLPAARNTGIAAARGEYVCCLDADDSLAPTYLELAIALMECDRSVGFAYSWVEFFGDVNQVWEARDFDPEVALIGNFTSVAAVFRRDDWETIGGYSPVMQGGFEDWEFWLRLASLGRRGCVINHPLFRHRRHGRTMTHEAFAMKAELQTRMHGLNQCFFENRQLRNYLRRLISPQMDFGEALTKLASPSVYAAPGRRSLLVVVAWLKRGGAEQLLLEILRGLHGSWHITVVTTRADLHPMSADFAAVTQEIYHLEGTLRPEHWPSFIDYLIRSRRPQTILISGSLWFLDHLRRVRAVLPNVRVVQLLHNHVPDGPFRAGLRNAELVNAFVCVSSKIPPVLSRHAVPATKIVHIANGIDAEGKFAAARCNRQAARDTLDIAPEQLALLWVGRLTAEKRPFDFVNIVAKLSVTIDIKAMMVGEGELAGSLTERIRGVGLGERLMLVGHVPYEAMADYYAAADVLVQTSALEGLPLVMLEALAMGCFVASTDVGDVAEVIRIGFNGFLVAADQPQAIADGLLALALEIRAIGGRQKISDAFRGSEYTLAKMLERYAQVLDRSSPHN